MTFPPRRDEPPFFSAPFPRRILSLIRPAPLLGLLAVLAGTGSAQAPAIAPAPDWVQPGEWTAPAKPEPNPAGQDFLLLDEQVRLASEESYRRHVYQIVNDSGRQRGAQVYFHFDPSFQTLTIHHLKLIRDGVASDRLDPAKIQVLQQERDLDRQLYNGERSALMILEDVRIGDIIDMAYSLRGQNPVFAGKFVDSFYVEWATPVRDQRYRLLAPAGRRIQHGLVTATPATTSGPTTRTLDGETEMSWRRLNTPIIESEERVPASHHVFAFVDLSEFTSWAEVVEWARPLYAPNDAPHPLLDATIAELRRKATTPEQRAVAALAFVQEEVRYLGIEMGPGSHRPSEPEEVLRRRFGDCKDKTRLLMTLLQGLDLTACPALVHSDHREAVRARLPSPYAFDHVIVALDLDGQRYLLDPTMSYQRGNRLALRHVGTYGPYLRIAAESRQLEDAVVGSGDLRRTNVRWDYQVDKLEQPATLTVTTVSEGRAADGLRSYFANRSLDQIGREYLDYYTHYHRGISQAGPIEHEDNPAANTYTVKEHYRITGLFAPDNNSKVLRAEFEPAGIWDYVRNPNLAQRRQPLALGYPVHFTESININLPEDWPISPQQHSINDPGFAFTFQSSNPRPRTVALNYSWSTRQSRVEPARFNEFSVGIDAARRLMGYELTWNTAAPAATAAATPAAANDNGFQINWPMLLLALGTLAGCAAAGWRLARIRNPRPSEPPPLAPAGGTLTYGAPKESLEGLGGWLILVAIGLFVRPAMLLSNLIQNREGYLNLNVWRVATTPGTENYNEHFPLLIPLEIIINCGLLGYSLVLIVLFFLRSHLFPRAIQLFFGLAFLTALFSIWENTLVGSSDAKAAAEGYGTLLQTVVAGMIWIPYFSVSRRVKATFVR